MGMNIREYSSLFFCCFVDGKSLITTRFIMYIICSWKRAWILTTNGNIASTTTTAPTAAAAAKTVSAEAFYPKNAKQRRIHHCSGTVFVTVIIIVIIHGVFARSLVRSLFVNLARISSSFSSFELMKLFKCMVREFELCTVVDQVWARFHVYEDLSQSLCFLCRLVCSVHAYKCVYATSFVPFGFVLFLPLFRSVSYRILYSIFIFIFHAILVMLSLVFAFSASNLPQCFPCTYYVW